MKNSPLSLPEQKDYEYGYKLAYELARQQLASLSDIEQQCRQSGARYQVTGSKSLIIIEYLRRSYQITLPGREISLVANGEEVPIKDKILILHYLTQARGTSLAKELVSYKQLPGASYFPTFYKRAIKPLVEHFGQQPQRLVEVAGELGGHEVDYGDVAVTLNAFKKVPLTLVLWRGDDEFPPGGSILFDATVSDYLSTEDINVLCEQVAWRLVKLLKEGSRHSSEA